MVLESEDAEISDPDGERLPSGLIDTACEKSLDPDFVCWLYLDHLVW